MKRLTFCFFVVVVVDDPKPRVKYVAVEGFAVVNDVVGDEQLAGLLGRHHLSSAMRTLLSTRFAASQLPQVNPNGYVEHRGVPSSAGSFTSEGSLTQSMFDCQPFFALFPL